MKMVDRIGIGVAAVGVAGVLPLGGYVAGALRAEANRPAGDGPMVVERVQTQVVVRTWRPAPLDGTVSSYDRVVPRAAMPEHFRESVPSFGRVTNVILRVLGVDVTPMDTGLMQPEVVVSYSWRMDAMPAGTSMSGLMLAQLVRANGEVEGFAWLPLDNTSARLFEAQAFAPPTDWGWPGYASGLGVDAIRIQIIESGGRTWGPVDLEVGHAPFAMRPHADWPFIDETLWPWRTWPGASP